MRVSESRPTMLSRRLVLFVPSCPAVVDVTRDLQFRNIMMAIERYLLKKNGIGNRKVFVAELSELRQIPWDDFISESVFRPPSTSYKRLCRTGA
jgi:hypothetical protein